MCAAVLKMKSTLRAPVWVSRGGRVGEGWGGEWGMGQGGSGSGSQAAELGKVAAVLRMRSTWREPVWVSVLEILFVVGKGGKREGGSVEDSGAIGVSKIGRWGERLLRVEWLLC